LKLAASLIALSVLAGSAGAAERAAGSAPSFAGAKRYATGDSPSSVAIGDLNGDGKPDLATANLGGTVSVLLSGSNGFAPKRSYEAGEVPHSLAIGDLNGDDKPDLASMGAEADRVSVFLNRGDGTFGGRREYKRAGSGSVAIGDLNGDGKPDIATSGGAAANAVSVLLNDGDGNFPSKRDYVTGRYADSIAIGDLNGDDKPDLAVANSITNTVSVLLNRGEGTFQAKRDHKTGSEPESVAIGDLDGDRKPDLVTANADPNAGVNTVSVLLNKGNGTFRAKRNYRAGVDPESVAIGDLNADGKPDLAIGHSLDPPFADAFTVSVLVNKGLGRFRARLGYPTGPSPVSVAISDLNGDGKPDLATANKYGNTVSVLLNAPGLCTVQRVRGRSLRAARRMLARANCRVGAIHRIYKTVKRGRVISQKPGFGAVLPGGSKVDLLVSRGRKPA
jgi:hypothetical protein